MSAALLGVRLFARLDGTESSGPRPAGGGRGPDQAEGLPRRPDDGARPARRSRWSIPLVSLGRTSLSLFIFHVIVFKQLSSTFGLYKRLGAAAALALAAAVIAALTTFSCWWGRYGYACGAEWLVRYADKIARRCRGSGCSQRPSEDASGEDAGDTR
jgi:hypothetical protein